MCVKCNKYHENVETLLIHASNQSYQEPRITRYYREYEGHSISSENFHINLVGQ